MSSTFSGLRPNIPLRYWQRKGGEGGEGGGLWHRLYRPYHLYRPLAGELSGDERGPGAAAPENPKILRASGRPKVAKTAKVVVFGRWLHWQPRRSKNRVACGAPDRLAGAPGLAQAQLFR